MVVQKKSIPHLANVVEVKNMYASLRLNLKQEIITDWDMN